MLAQVQCQPGAKLPYYTDCTKYIDCSCSCGNAKLVSCPSGQQFNAAAMVKYNNNDKSWLTDTEFICNDLSWGENEKSFKQFEFSNSNVEFFLNRIIKRFDSDIQSNQFVWRIPDLVKLTMVSDFFHCKSIVRRTSFGIQRAINFHSIDFPIELESDFEGSVLNKLKLKFLKYLLIFIFIFHTEMRHPC